ncbi:MAG: outer membrane protein assembly factor BamE [Methylococcaceae bacterium]|nr:outer membrane protein assembly factor BamE [Methylococcaceae bacterium]
MRKSLFSLALLGSLTLSGCSTIMNNLPGVYTLDIQQGNRVSQEMINQLKPNMNKRQVLYIMGSPMLVDVFDKKRWDYLYSSQLSGEAREQLRISLYFEGDILIGVQGDFRPDNTAKKVAKEMTVDVPKRDLDHSLWGNFVRLISSDDSDIEDTTVTEENESNAVSDSENVSGSNKATTAALEKEPEQIVEKRHETVEQEKPIEETQKATEIEDDVTEKTSPE